MSTKHGKDHGDTGGTDTLKSERVELALKAMPEWQLNLQGQAITRIKELPSPKVAPLYAAYVTALAGDLGLPVTVSVTANRVFLALYAAPGRDGHAGGVNPAVLNLARHIG